jgi:hypothetical protein
MFNVSELTHSDVISAAQRRHERNNAAISAAAVVSVGKKLSDGVWRMKRARMSSPSASAAVAGDNATGGSATVIPPGVSALAVGVPASRVRPYAPAARREVAKWRFMVRLQISRDAPSLIRAAGATIRATTQLDLASGGGYHPTTSYLNSTRPGRPM